MAAVRFDRTTAAASVLIDSADPAASERAFLVLYYTEDAAPHTRVVPLPDGVPVTFGRASTASVPIEAEQVSRQHARVVRRGADIYVEDLGSRNGTHVNGVRVDGTTRLGTGDELVIGPVSAIVGVTTSMQQRTLVGSSFEFDDRLASECDRAVRYQRSLGLAMLRLDGTSDAATAALERVAKNLRRMDYVAQYGPEEFAIILPEADVDATEAAGLPQPRLAASGADLAGALGAAQGPRRRRQRRRVQCAARGAGRLR